MRRVMAAVCEFASVFSVLLLMSEPSWLEPNPGHELSVSWLSPLVGSRTGSTAAGHSRTSATMGKVAVAASAAGAAADAARAAQDLLLSSHHTPRKKKTSREPASSEKQRMRSSSVQRSKCDEAGEGAVLCAPGGALEPQAREPDSDGQRSEHGADVQRSTDSGIIKAKRHYTKRGTAGTFRGRRPPKNPEKLKEFLEAKAAYDIQHTDIRFVSCGFRQTQTGHQWT